MLSLKTDETIRIFLRVKPLDEKEAKNQGDKKLFDFPDQTSVSVHYPKTSSQSKQTPIISLPSIYQFPHVFQQETSQKDFFSGTILPSLENFFKGDNLLIFSYG
jgi:hypothetical protein